MAQGTASDATAADQVGGARPVRIALLGAGDRGMMYARESVHRNGAVVVAVAEPRPTRLQMAGDEMGVSPDRRVGNWSELLDHVDEFDCVVIATPDKEHAAPAIAFLDRGLPILLEKPMAPREEDARAIVEAAARTSSFVCVAHELRYMPYTQHLKKVIDDGVIGDVVSVQHLEPIGWDHFAHSYVRGNWRREDEASSMLMSKSCHDLDWLSYVIGQRAVRVSSFGSLMHFRSENAPAGAASRCLECPVAATCPYSAVLIYLDRFEEPRVQYRLKVLADDPTRENVRAALRDGPFGRCAYQSDNDVVDHQVVNVEYEGGVTASFTVAAFTPNAFRKTRIFGTRGSLEGDGTHVEHYDFLTASRTVTEIAPESSSGHLGADTHLVRAFIEMVSTGDGSRILSSAEESLRTHQVVWAAERSRHSGTVVTL